MINLTQAQRDALIAHCKSSIEHLELKKKTWGAVWAKFLDLEILSHKITLYSLEAKPVYMVEHDNHKNHGGGKEGVSWVETDKKNAEKHDDFGLLARIVYTAPPVHITAVTVDDFKPGGRLFEYIESIPREELQKFINGEF